MGSLVLFLAACYLPALEFRRNEAGREIWSGGQCLAIGWLGLLAVQFAWLANAWLLLAAVFLLQRRRRDCIISVVLALVFSMHVWVLFNGSVPGDEANVSKLFLTRLREGTYLWQASMVVMLVGAIVAKLTPLDNDDMKPVADWHHPNEDQLPPRNS